MGYRVGRFVARRLEVAAVAGLLWILWCVLGAGGFFRVFFFGCFCLRTHTVYCKYEAHSFTSLLVYICIYWLDVILLTAVLRGEINDYAILGESGELLLAIGHKINRLAWSFTGTSRFVVS